MTNLICLVHIDFLCLHQPTGKRYTMPFVHVVHFNDEGRVNYVREYNDTREMVIAFGGRA